MRGRFLEGRDQVIGNMLSRRAITARGLRRGLKKGGLYLQRKSQRLVPVDIGNLKSSAFTREVSLFGRRDVVVGYTSNYAVFVHEAPMKLKGKPRPRNRGMFWDPVPRASNKFLETPMREERSSIYDIIAKEAKQ